MKSTLVFLAAAGVTVLGVAWAEAANLMPLSAGVEARFGSQSNVYTDSDPASLTVNAPGAGPYTAGLPLPGHSATLGSGLYSSTWGNGFQIAAGGPWTSNFVDTLVGTTGFTAATSQISDIYFQVHAFTADAQITFPAWRFVQGPAAPGYAFEQLNFRNAYHVTANAAGMLGSTPVAPLNVNGSIKNPGNYAQFDAQMAYWWTPVNAAMVPTGPAAPLGSLSYSVLATGVGPFAITAPSTGTIFPTPAGDGILELNGYAYIAGDPFEMNISVPEPTSLALIPAAGLLLLLRRRRLRVGVEGRLVNRPA